MTDIAQRYAIPAELTAFIDSGFIQLLAENEAEKTVRFDIPALAWTDDQDRDTTFTLLWIHPEFNAQFCHYYDEKPGDLANFYVFKETTDLGDEWLDINDLDGLLDWLGERQASRS